MSQLALSNPPSSLFAVSPPREAYQPDQAAPRVRRKGGGALAAVCGTILLIDFAAFAVILLGLA